MKKFLFLLLGLAVSASAYAGINAQRIEKQAAPKSMVAEKNASAILKAAKQQKPYVMTPFEANVRTIEQSQMRAPVTEQPEGTMKYYKRTAGTALFLYPDEETGQYAFYTGDQEGYVVAIENGNTIWFLNLLYDPAGYLPDYWIKGTKSGTRVTITIPQEVANTTQYGNVVFGFGTYTSSTSGINFTPSTNTTIRYNLDSSTGKLTLQGTNANNNTGLAVYWEDDRDLIGMEWGTVLEVATDVPEAPAMYTDADIDAMAETGGELVEYNRTGNALTTTDGNNINTSTQYGSTYIYYAADGSVYMRNPVYGYRSGIWVKGTKNGNKITVPVGQYVDWDLSHFVGTKIAWGEAVFTPNEETGGNLVSFTPDLDVTEVTYTIDDKTITLDGTSEYVGLATVDVYSDGSESWYPNLDYSTTYWVIPGIPEALTVTPAATTADVAWTDTENDMWNLRYRIHDTGSEAYFNDFNDYGSDTYLDDWYIIDADGDGNGWGIVQYDDAGTEYCLWSASYLNGVGPLTPDNWLISEVVNLNGVVRLNAWGLDPNYAGEVFSVYVLPAEDWETTADFIDISGNVTANSNMDQEYNFSIPAEYQGLQGRIAIRHHDVTDMFYLVFDNLYVGDPDYVPATWTTVTGITEKPYTITGLDPETTYDVQVQGANPGGPGSWTDITVFTTLAEGGYLRGDVDGSGTVDITDATTLINYLLYGNANPFVEDNADVDYSGDIDITDATTLINYLLYGNWPD